MRNKLAVVVVAAALCGFAAYAFAGPPLALVGASPSYSATVYVAGQGGHFSKSDVTITPGDAENPLRVTNLELVAIGTPKSHVFHDGRIDSQDRGTIFWSTIALDEQGKLHVGKTDLKTGQVVKDVAFAPDPRSPTAKPPAYCASGQTRTTFMPVFMGNEGYVDVFDKKTLKHLHRVFVSDLGYKAGAYQFVHGSNSNDMKKFLLTVTMKGEDGKMNGKQDLVMLDLPALEKGKFKVLARTTLTGEPGKTIAFRQYFTRDDKRIFQAAGDRMWVIDAATLKMIDEKVVGKEYGENHDVQPTPDGKYALLTLRTADTTACDTEGKPMADKKITDGALLLYDAGARKVVGKTASVCFGCHKEMGKGDKNALLCGIAAAFKK
ncbi:MAG TPA: hypothetical protein VLD85_00250 [Anaeromyxobacteraceae bacterium]|nr:hypothetical protein [Anaeromyxobacteraceae bacterium]